MINITTFQLRPAIDNIIFQTLQVSQINDYYKEMESHNLVNQEKYKEKISEIIQKNDDDLDADSCLTLKNYYENKLDYYNSHSQFLRRTTFLEIYFSFENFMNIKCELYKELNNLNINFKAQGITKAQQFLSKHFSMNEPFNSAAWNQILLYNRTRNVIAHHQSKVTRLDDHSIKRLNGLNTEHTFSNGFSFTLDKNFVPTFIETIDAFLDKLN
ncbi:hypothetical protein [Bacillus sp. FSL K6-3200]|uniref:hypothetical protein n=1 Tax=Bacillus sp. FSL K6-3200 TaxID=2921496 RepID=UPI00315AA7C9